MANDLKAVPGMNLKALLSYLDGWFCSREKERTRLDSRSSCMVFVFLA